MAFLILILLVFALSGEEAFTLIDAGSSVFDPHSDEVEGLQPEWRAALLNLAVPGVGHLTLKDRERATLYLTFEAVVLGGAIFTSARSNRYSDDALSIAHRSAGVSSRRSRDDVYWRHIGMIQSSESWNEAMEQSREFDRRYLKDEDQWQWSSRSERERYRDTRSRSKDWEEVSSILFVAMGVNRLISFVDGRISTEEYNRNLRGSVYTAPIIGSDALGLSLNIRF